MGIESSDVIRFDIGPLFQGHMRIAKLKRACNSLIVAPSGFGCYIYLYFSEFCWPS